MPRPRKTTEPVAPGPHVLEIRFNNKIVHMQRVHSYSVDQQDDHFTVVGVMKLKPQPEPEVVEPA